jgi:hypothetical protein
LSQEFGAEVDLSLSLRRFRNHYSEGQTSRNWDARFENWVLADAERMREREGTTDEFGIPRHQKASNTRVPQPGDEDYFDGGQYLDGLREDPAVSHCETR